jgi:hypothetical protein
MHIPLRKILRRRGLTPIVVIVWRTNPTRMTPTIVTLRTDKVETTRSIGVHIEPALKT